MKAARGIVFLLLVVLAVNLSIVAYVRVTSVTGSRKGCERGKLDRIDNAAFQKAQSTYIQKVVLAQSVKGDVKAAAKDARKTFKQTAAHLTARSKIDCKETFPMLPGGL